MTIWENTKLKISTVAGKFAAEKAKKKRVKLMELSKELNFHRDNQGISLTDTTVKQRQVTNEIKEIYQEQAKSCNFISKARWQAEGEKKTQNIFID